MTAPDAITAEAERLAGPHQKGDLGICNCGRSERVAAIAAAIRKAAEEEREACAMLHESIDNDCDRDRIAEGSERRCGCGAMGAVIEYRDAIRARSHAQPEPAKTYACHDEMCPPDCWCRGAQPAALPVVDLDQRHLDDDTMRGLKALAQPAAPEPEDYKPYRRVNLDAADPLPVDFSEPMPEPARSTAQPAAPEPAGGTYKPAPPPAVMAEAERLAQDWLTEQAGDLPGIRFVSGPVNLSVYSLSRFLFAALQARAPRGR